MGRVCWQHCLIGIQQNYHSEPNTIFVCKGNIPTEKYPNFHRKLDRFLYLDCWNFQVIQSDSSGELPDISVISSNFSRKIARTYSKDWWKKFFFNIFTYSLKNIAANMEKKRWFIFSKCPNFLGNCPNFQWIFMEIARILGGQLPISAPPAPLPRTPM